MKDYTQKLIMVTLLGFSIFMTNCNKPKEELVSMPNNSQTNLVVIKHAEYIETTGGFPKYCEKEKQSYAKRSVKIKLQIEGTEYSKKVTFDSIWIAKPNVTFDTLFDENIPTHFELLGCYGESFKLQKDSVVDNVIYLSSFFLYDECDGVVPKYGIIPIIEQSTGSGIVTYIYLGQKYNFVIKNLDTKVFNLE
jgi:hypothetical protein